MPMNAIYKGPDDLPGVIPVFPLPGALLLPRGQMPLNIFEPRYLAMIDDALRSGIALIGMIQPDPAHPGPDQEKPQLFRVGCVGRITQFAESGDGRYLIQLTGVARFRVEDELAVATPYRQCRVTYRAFPRRLHRAQGRGGGRPQDAVAHARGIPQGQQPQGRLGRHRECAQRGTGQRLGDDVALWPAEKQALLEAPDLKTRAEILVAVTEIELAKSKTTARHRCNKSNTTVNKES